MIDRRSELSVDTDQGGKFTLSINVDLYHLACGAVSLDVMDVSGDNQLVDVEHTIYKRRIDDSGNPIDAGSAQQGVEKVSKIGHNSSGVGTNAVATDELTRRRSAPGYCGSCYSASPSNVCCNDCDSVRLAYQKKGWVFNPETIEQCVEEGKEMLIAAKSGEGCNVFGTLEVNKVSGNVHFAPGRSFADGDVHIHDLSPFQDINFNTSHRIRHLSFGTEIPGFQADAVHPLDNFVWKNDTSMQFQYFIKVVPTVHRSVGGILTTTNQFSATKNSVPLSTVTGRNLPGVFFYFDVVPLKVLITEKRRSFLEFLTSVCAIIGGIFTVSGIIESILHHGLLQKLSRNLPIARKENK